MSTPKLIRWSGIALILAGVLDLSNLFHPDETDPNALANPAWGPVHVILGIGFLVSLIGLVGLYLRLVEKDWILSTAGFVLAFFSVATVAGLILFLEGFIVPALARSSIAEAALDPAGPVLGGPVIPIFMGAARVFVLGAILLGISIVRSRVLPRWAGVSLAVGAPLWIFSPPLPYVVYLLGGALVSIGYIWSGYAVWASGRQPAAQPGPAVVGQPAASN